MMQIKKGTFGHYLLCIFSGVVTAFLFQIPELGFLSFLSLTPAFYSFMTVRQNKKQLAFCSAIFCASLFLIYYTSFFNLDISVRTDHSSLYLLAGWLVASALQGSIYFAAIYFGMQVRCPLTVRPLMLALFWVVAELLCALGPLGMPAVRLGLTLWLYPSFIQSAALFGILFVSFLIVVINGYLAAGLFSRKRGMPYLFVAASLLCANLFGGFAALSRPLPKKELTFCAVQPNMPSFAGFPQDELFEHSYLLAKEAAKKNPDLLLLPENAFPGSVQFDEALTQAANDLTHLSKGSLIFGSHGLYGFEQRNSLFFVPPEGGIQSAYQKQQLVPFFENGYDQPFSFYTGSERGIFDTKSGKIGVMICFESMFSSIAKETVEQGAELLIIATNDSWFNGDIPKTKHLSQAVFRAVETGRTTIQVSMDGATACVNPLGLITYSLPYQEEGILCGTAALSTVSTPYLTIGNGWIVLLGAVCLYFIVRYSQKKYH